MVASTGAAAPREFREGEVQQPHARTILDAKKHALLGGNILAVGQLVPGVVSGLGNVIDGNCRCSILHAAGRPFIASVRGDIDSPAKELEFLAASDEKSDRDPVEKALNFRAMMEALGINQQQLGERFGFTPVQVSRKLAPLKMHPDILAAHRADPKGVTAAHLVVIRRAKGEEAQLALLDRILAEKLSVTEAGKALKPKRTGRPRKMATVSLDGVVFSYPADLDAAGLSASLDKLRERFAEGMRQFKKGAAPAALVLPGN